MYEALKQLAKERVPYGKMFVTLSNNDGSTVSANATFVESIGKYSNNWDARMAIEKIIADIENTKKTGGAITITIHPLNGVVSQISVQNNSRYTIKI